MTNEGRAPQITTQASAGLFLAGRVLAALAFMSMALGQIIHYEDACSAAKNLGMPLAHAYVALSILLQFSGSVLLALGLRARIGVSLLIASLLPALWLFMDPLSNRVYLSGAIAALGGLLPYLALGPGPWSMDNLYHTLSKER
ncbi:MAG: DoxX family protein [Elusimicrobiales bacterium]|nr:DoxX family protein [Elusimicrobiales bacterium]